MRLEETVVEPVDPTVLIELLEQMSILSQCGELLDSFLKKNDVCIKKNCS